VVVQGRKREHYLTSVEPALIRGLITAFPNFVRGLVPILWAGIGSLAGHEAASGIPHRGPRLQPCTTDVDVRSRGVVCLRRTPQTAATFIGAGAT
jgi:hypothetical protein